LICALAATKAVRSFPFGKLKGQDFGGRLKRLPVASSLERSDRIIHPKLSSEPGWRGELPANKRRSGSGG